MDTYANNRALRRSRRMAHKMFRTSTRSRRSTQAYAYAPLAPLAPHAIVGTLPYVTTERSCMCVFATLGTDGYGLPCPGVDAAPIHYCYAATRDA